MCVILPGGVDIAGVLALHPPVLVVQARLDYSVPNSLKHQHQGLGTWV